MRKDEIPPSFTFFIIYTSLPSVSSPALIEEISRMPSLSEQQARQTIDAVLAATSFAAQDYNPFSLAASGCFVLQHCQAQFAMALYLY